jgi:hypothetical protein
MGVSVFRALVGQVEALAATAVALDRAVNSAVRNRMTVGSSSGARVPRSSVRT